MNQLVGIILGIALMIGGFLSFSALAPVNAAIESEDLSIQYFLIGLGFILISCGIISLVVITKEDKSKKNL